MMNVGRVNENSYYTNKANRNKNANTSAQAFDSALEEDNIENAGGVESPSSRSFTGIHESQNAYLTEQAAQQWAEVMDKKRQNILNSIQHLCAILGRESPKHYEDISETDFAIWRTEQAFGREGGYAGNSKLIVMHPNTVYGYNNKPTGFQHIYKNAYHMAQMDNNLEYLSSTEGINDLLNSGWKLGENVDKEAIYTALKAISERQRLEVDKSIKKTIENIASTDAVKYLSYITGDFETGYADRMKAHPSYESLCNSIQELLRESTSDAKELIKEGASKDYLSKMEAQSYENSTVKFHINGKEYSRQEFEDGFKNLLLGKGNIFTPNN